MLIVAIDTDGTMFPLPKADHISQWIEESRKTKGLSLQAVADHVGVARQAVWTWEKGKSVPMVEHLAKLLDVLGPPPKLKASKTTKKAPVIAKKLSVSTLEEIESILGV